MNSLAESNGKWSVSSFSKEDRHLLPVNTNRGQLLRREIIRLSFEGLQAHGVDLRDYDGLPTVRAVSELARLFLYDVAKRTRHEPSICRNRRMMDFEVKEVWRKEPDVHPEMTALGLSKEERFA